MATGCGHAECNCNSGTVLLLWNKRGVIWDGGLMVSVEFYLYPTVGTVLIHSIKPELTE